MREWVGEVMGRWRFGGRMSSYEVAIREKGLWGSGLTITRTVGSIEYTSTSIIFTLPNSKFHASMVGMREGRTITCVGALAGGAVLLKKLTSELAVDGRWDFQLGFSLVSGFPSSSSCLVPNFPTPTPLTKRRFYPLQKRGVAYALTVVLGK